MSLTPQASLELTDDASIKEDDNDDGNGSSVVASTPPASSANESNFNLVYDDFNLASVSMSKTFTLFIYFLFYFRSSLFVCLFARLIFH